MDERCDRDLVLASRRGDRSAYAVLVGRYHRQVFWACFGVLGHLHDAEDMAQDAMLKGFERIRQLRDGSQFSGWIVTIARNLSINLLRRRKTAEKALDGRRPRWPDRAQAENEPLQTAIGQLPWDLRLPLVMYYFDGRNVKAVAKTLDISTSGVYAKLRNAIQELHDILTRQGETS